MQLKAYLTLERDQIMIRRFFAMWFFLPGMIVGFSFTSFLAGFMAGVAIVENSTDVQKQKDLK